MVGGSLLITLLGVSLTLSGSFHKYDHAGGEGFFAQTRRERRAYPRRSVRCEQRGLREKEPPHTLADLWNGPLRLINEGPTAFGGVGALPFINHKMPQRSQQKTAKAAVFGPGQRERVFRQEPGEEFLRQVLGVGSALTPSPHI
jgi:hypothetical protein